MGSETHELISVIIPVYNVRSYLVECLRSVTSQNYKNLEIILIDDGSRDGSGEVCDEWARKDPRIIVVHKENEGVSSARNGGLEIANGAYIGFVDADDWIELDMYRKLKEAISDADFVSCGYVEYPMGNLDVAILNGRRFIDGPCSPKDAAIYIYEREGYLNSVCNKLFRREAVFCKENNSNKLEPIRFEEGLVIGEDEVWLAKVLHNSLRVSFVPEALYHIRPRQGSATRKAKLTEREMTVFTAKWKAMKFLPQDREVQELCKAVMFNDCYSYKVRAYCAGDKKHFRKIEKILGKAKKYWIKSDKAKPLFKAKVHVLEAEMKMGFPRSLVNFTYNVKRFGLKK